MHIEKKTLRLYCCDECDFKSNDMDHVKDHEKSNHTSVKELWVCGHELYWFDDRDTAVAWMNNRCMTTCSPNHTDTDMVFWWKKPGWYELINDYGSLGLKSLECVLADLDKEAAEIRYTRQTLITQTTAARPKRGLKLKKLRAAKR